ncbi:hypothetical protein, partial [Vulcanisaeta distributa]|uniref:hypothetical protein n=1 Tax=Vulcanisaeta distributa TaxID=164451 RepID=UPI001FB2E6A7
MLRGGWVPERRATLADVIRVFVTAKAYPMFREQVLALCSRYLGEYVQSLGRTWHVTNEDIETYVKAMRLRGGVRDRTLRDRLHYIQRALSDLDWVLSPEALGITWLRCLVRMGLTWLGTYRLASSPSLRMYSSLKTQAYSQYSTTPSRPLSQGATIRL